MLNIDFNVQEAIRWSVESTQEYAKRTGLRGVVLGISGGKDCAVVAAICVKALGKENVVGLLMPNGQQKDIQYAYDTVNHLGIRWAETNIYSEFCDTIQRRSDIMEQLNVKYSELEVGNEGARMAKINIAPRLRMKTLYDTAQALGYRVVGTGNLSERVMGYTTKWGDSACDFNPIGNYTCNEVILMGRELGLPEHVWNKKPEDGLTGKTDEEVMGVSYDDIHRVIRMFELEKVSEETIGKIDKAFKYSGSHKIKGVELFPNSLYNTYA